jgi:hypothetical protein
MIYLIPFKYKFCLMHMTHENKRALPSFIFFMVEANISLLKVLSYEEGEDQDALWFAREKCPRL